MRRLGEEAAALDHDLTVSWNDRDDPVHVVSRPDRQLVELAQAIELQTIVPLTTRPCV